ncbi:MAG: helix-turn-helix domain-containing protein [Mycobacteriales bacterium]
MTELMRERARLRLGKKRGHVMAGRAAEDDVPPQAIAAQLGLSEPTVSNMIRRYRNNPDAFTRAPMDVVLERAAGEIDQATMLEQLVDWPYTATIAHDANRGELAEHMTV